MPISTLCRTIRASHSCTPPGKGSGSGSVDGRAGISMPGNSITIVCRAARSASRAALTWAASIARSACRTSLSRCAASPRATRRAIASCSRISNFSCACISSATMKLRSHPAQTSNSRLAIWCSASSRRISATLRVRLPMSRSIRALFGKRTARLSWISHSL